MFKDPNFKTNISIENIRTENFISYIYIKFLTPKPSKENLCYRLWIEDLDTGIYDLALNSYIWIDRFSSEDHYEYGMNPSIIEHYNNVININRNKTIYIPIKLYMQNISGNRFIKHIKLHLKKQNITGSGEPSSWISDEIFLASREILIPEPKCQSIKILNDGKLECKFTIKYPTARDKTNFNNYITPYVLFYNNNNLIETERVESSHSETPESFIFRSKESYAYDFTNSKTNKNINNKVNKIAIEFRFLNGTLASKEEITLNSFKNFLAFYANETDIIKCKNLGMIYLYSNEDNNKIFKAKRIIDIYKQS